MGRGRGGREGRERGYVRLLTCGLCLKDLGFLYHFGFPTLIERHRSIGPYILHAHPPLAPELAFPFLSRKRERERGNACVCVRVCVCVSVLRSVPGIRCCGSKTAHTGLGRRRGYSRRRCIWIVIIVVVIVLVIIMDMGRGGGRRR